MTEETGLVVPATTPQGAVEAFHEFQTMKQKLLTKDDTMVIKNKDRILKSGWLKIAAAFNISDEIVQQERMPLIGKGGEILGFVWAITVRTTAPNGRHCDATGSCASNERQYAHPDHDVRAMAHVRAKNRAIADLVGGADLNADDIGPAPVAPERWTRFDQTLERAGVTQEQAELALGCSPREFVASELGSIEQAYRMIMESVQGTES